MQMSMFEVAQYDDLCAANAEKVEALCGDDTAATAVLAMMVVERRLELVIAHLKGVRLLGPDFEYLAEQAIGVELDELL